MARSIYRNIDQSKHLADTLQNLSTGLARRRGLPLIIAIGLTLLSLLVHVIAAFFPTSVLLALLSALLLHAAILTGLIGVLFAEAVGRG